MLKCSMYIAPNVPTSEMGTATEGMMVARQSRRKTNTTRITRSTERIKVRSTSATDERIVTV